MAIPKKYSQTAILNAAKDMDWQQVVLNGGPPCFHLDEDGSFCGRAKRWFGHDGHPHKFVPLDAMMRRFQAETLEGAAEEFRKIKDVANKNYFADALNERAERIRKEDQ